MKRHREMVDIPVQCSCAEIGGCEFCEPCLDCGGKGWELYNEGEWNEGIQRCDSCKEFATDEEAQEAAKCEA